MQVCFIGHRVIQENEELVSLLKQTILELINKGVTDFLFGSKSMFDDLSWRIVTELKEKYTFIKRIYVRSSYQHIDNAYENYLLERYEQTYFPPKLQNAGKYSYVERNYEMIDKSTYCIFYYNQNYVAQAKRPYKHDKILQKNRRSGTKIAYEYALKKKKTIYNLYK